MDTVLLREMSLSGLSNKTDGDRLVRRNVRVSMLKGDRVSVNDLLMRSIIDALVADVTVSLLVLLLLTAITATVTGIVITTVSLSIFIGGVLLLLFFSTGHFFSWLFKRGSPVMWLRIMS